MEKNNFNIGIDIEDIKRFKKMAFSASLLNKIFTDKERAYCLAKHAPAQHLAARFAAKEAVSKALSVTGGLKLEASDYKKIEITHGRNGEPNAKIKGLKNYFIKISLSHCSDKAVAVAMIIKK